MTANDFDRTARLWLQEGPSQLADRVLQATLDEVHFTRQRRAWWPARKPPTRGMAFRLAGVAAVLVVAVAGFRYFSSGEGGPGGPLVSPTPLPSPRGSIVEGDFVPLEPGTYITADPFLVRATFTVPAGWTGHLGGSNMAQLVGPGEILIVAFDDVYADPCHYEQGLLDPRPGPTVDDLVAAFTGMSDLMPGLDATTPTDVTVGGYAGKQLTITLAGDYDGCTISPEGPALWELPEGGALYTMGASEGDRVWILDVEGQRIVIIGSAIVWKTPQVQAEVQGIVDSIRLAPIDLTDSNS